ncbi:MULTISPECIES: hypothetical protein [unclassified Adlercreutzia]|uniref:hypothetical protein n=1 Tax=unclassified Adlercreutzia TaxID=2636013 RepID=UPI0013EE3371|nr:MULTISPECIES: hypothetical protein [unclassified Adlercreutzia]
MKKRQEYDWLNDPFDEEAQKAELQKAHSSQSRSCILVILVLLVLIIVLALFGCSVFAELNSFE